MLEDKMVKRFEVWFQYNKAGNFRFEGLKKAINFANKFRKNKPIVYDLVRDESVSKGIINYYG